MEIHAETPVEHFDRCGPFCDHVRFCEKCSNGHGLCSEHRGNPEASVYWKGTKR